MNVYQLRILGHTTGGNFFENVLHFNVDETHAGPYTPYQYATDLIDAFDAAATTLLLDALSHETTIDYYTAKRITGGGGGESVNAVGAVGLLADPAASSGIAVNTQLYTASPTNRAGHVYLAGVFADGVINDVVDAGLKTLLENLWDALLAGLTLTAGNGTAKWVVWSRKLLAAYDIIFYVIDDVISYFNQRKKPLV